MTSTLLPAATRALAGHDSSSVSLGLLLRMWVKRSAQEIAVFELRNGPSDSIRWALRF